MRRGRGDDTSAPSKTVGSWLLPTVWRTPQFHRPFPCLLAAMGYSVRKPQEGPPIADRSKGAATQSTHRQSPGDEPANMKVWIDQDLCTGDGLCEEIAP